MFIGCYFQTAHIFFECTSKKKKTFCTVYFVYI